MVTIEDLGVHDVDVYDLETENTNMFFANDILVHNSSYLNFGPYVAKTGLTDTKEIVEHLHNFCKTDVQEAIQAAFAELSTYINARVNKLYMKRENLCATATWIAKKRYFMDVYDSEGVRYSEPKLKIVGLEPVRSTTPEWCRERLKKCFTIICRGTQEELWDYVVQCEKDYQSLAFEDIAQSISAGHLGKYGIRMANGAIGFAPHCPFQVRGALSYNYYIEQDEAREKVCRLINEGDKVKYAALLMPNPTGQNVLSVPGFLHRSLGLEQYVDRRTQYEKTFYEPLKAVTNVVGWSPERRTLLSDFYED